MWSKAILHFRGGKKKSSVSVFTVFILLAMKKLKLISYCVFNCILTILVYFRFSRLHMLL